MKLLGKDNHQFIHKNTTTFSIHEVVGKDNYGPDWYHVGSTCAGHAQPLLHCP